MAPSPAACPSQSFSCPPQAGTPDTAPAKFLRVPRQPACRRGSFLALPLPASSSAAEPHGLRRTETSRLHPFSHPDLTLRAWPWGWSAQGSGHLPKARRLGELGTEGGCPATSALLPSITTGFPEEGTAAAPGTRKRLDRWGVGGSSQQMGPRGRKESGPGVGEGAQGCGDGPRSREVRRRGGERVNRAERGGGNPQRRGRGRGTGGGPGRAHPELAEGAAPRAPCTTAPPAGASRIRHGFHFLSSVTQSSLGFPRSQARAEIFGGRYRAHFSAKGMEARRGRSARPAWQKTGFQSMPSFPPQ